jgi:hypothetical protein
MTAVRELSDYVDFQVISEQIQSDILDFGQDFELHWLGDEGPVHQLRKSG